MIKLPLSATKKREVINEWNICGPDEAGRLVRMLETAESVEDCLHGTVELKNVERFLGDYVHSGQCKACGVKVYRMRGRRWVSDLEDFVEHT